jgi:hypothetical protein
MVWKTSTANLGLNDIEVCWWTLYTDLIAQSIFICQSMCLLANTRFNAFKSYYEQVNFYCILKLVVTVFYFTISRKILLLQCYISLFSVLLLCV